MKRYIAPGVEDVTGKFDRAVFWGILAYVLIGIIICVTV